MQITTPLLYSLILFFAFQQNAYSQGDPVNSPDSLYARRNIATGIEKANIDLEIARYYFPQNTDSLKFYIDILEAHNSIQYDKRIDAFIKKFKGFIAQANLETNKAMDYAQESMILFRELEDYREMGWLCIQLGTNYYRLGNFASATDLNLQALGYFEQVNHLRGIGQAYNELGRISYQTGQHSAAKEYFESALNIFNDLDLASQKYKLYNNLGILMLDNQELSSALKNFLMAAEGYKNSEDFRRLAIVYGNIALSFEDMGERDSAMIYARRALKLSSDINYIYGEITATINMGYFYRLQQEYDSSLLFLNKALAKAFEKELPVNIENVYQEFTDLFADMEDFRTAFSYHLKKDSIHNQIMDDESKKQIEELLFSYKQKIKEQELIQLREYQQLQTRLNLIFIIFIFFSLLVILLFIRGNSRIKNQKKLLEKKNKLLNKSKTSLEESEEILKEMIQYKNKLFSIVAHDLRNPVAAVSGFSELLSQNYDSLDDDSRKEYLEQILQAAMRTLSLLENLLLWAKSQMDNVEIKRSNITVDNLVEDSLSPMLSALERKKLKLEIEIVDKFDLFVDIEMMKAVLRNLISNAIKFSYSGKSIKIKCFIKENNYCISVIDNGTGIKADILSGLFSSNDHSSTQGTEQESGSGLGLIISQDYTEKNDGLIHVESKIGEGSVFTVCFPKS